MHFDLNLLLPIIASHEWNLGKQCSVDREQTPQSTFNKTGATVKSSACGQADT